MRGQTDVRETWNSIKGGRQFRAGKHVRILKDRCTCKKENAADRKPCAEEECKWNWVEGGRRTRCGDHINVYGWIIAGASPLQQAVKKENSRRDAVIDTLLI